MITTANRRGFTQVQVPEDNTLLPTCLVLMLSVAYNGEMAISLGFLVEAMR